MRQDQLEKARAERWRQDGNALVTLDDAERWLAETPLCLYLPRRIHLPVPAPSFVEAVAGASNATPGPEQLAPAAEMLGRLVASGAVVALSLFGAAAGVGGEQPDFLATPEALPFLYALQPDRNPKRAPSTVGSGRVSPLAAEAYKTLERDGAQTAIELRERLGREVTEAAVLRALSELWHTMRAVPVPATAGDLDLSRGAHWELLVARHRRELTVGSTQAQTTALAMLISFYLRSAVAATGEDAELFLSPVSSRARIRDVVHGLTATRQLGEFSLGGNAQLYVEGSLPEIVEEVVIVASEDAGLEENEPSLLEAAANGEGTAPVFKRPAAQRSPRPAFGSARPAFGDRARTGVAARGRTGAPGDGPPRREGGFRKPAEGEFGRRSEAGRGAAGPGLGRPRTAGGTGPRSFGPRTSGAGSDRPRSDRPRTGAPRTDRPRTDRPRTGAPRTDRPRSERPPRTNRLTSSGQPRRPGGGFRRDAAGTARPPRPFSAASDAGGAAEPRRPSFSRGPARPASGPRTTGGRPPFRSGGSARPQGDRPFAKREGAGSSDRPRSFARPAAARSGADSRPPRRDAGAGGAAPFKKPYAPRTDRPAGDRPFKKPYAPRGERPGGERPTGDRPFKKPYAPRGERPVGDRPFKKPYAPRTGAGPGRPSASGDAAPRRSFTPRPGAEGAEGGGPPRRTYTPRPAGAAGAARAPRPSFGKGPGAKGPGRAAGAPRPGGFSKPGGKPAFSKPGFSKAGFSKAGGFSKPGGRKPGAAGKGFGAPRPVGSRPTGPRAGASSAGRPRSAGPPRGAGAGKPGGFGPPRRKPKAPGAGDEG